MRKYTIHIDMSGRFYKKKPVGVAYVAVENINFHEGLVLSGKIVKSLTKNKSSDLIFSKIYAICIYFLLKKNIKKFKKIIICNDEPFQFVKKYLSLLFGNIPTKITSLSHHRNILGKNIRSLAHKKANSYRKRGMHRTRWHRGTRLNLKFIKKEEIFKLLEKLGER